MAAMKHIPGRILFVVIMVLLVGGCGLFSRRADSKDVGRIDARGKRVVIIPFQDSEYYYFHSADGIVLASYTAVRLQERSPKTEVVVPEPGQAMLPLKEPTDADWQALGEALSGDYLVAGEIVRLTTRDPGVIGMLRGTLVARVFVCDVQTGSTCLQETFTVFYPPGSPGGVGVPTHDVTEAVIRKGVVAVAASRIAEIFRK